jgi:hypothetical protein
MPDLGGLISRLITFIGDVVGASSLRLGVVATIVVLGILLLLLSLVARPARRWSPGDLGGFRAVGRAMATAAETGAAASVSLGTAGIARSTSALQRIATLAALPLLAHVARAAARSGVPLEVSTNDPISAVMADGVIEGAHRSTETLERIARSRVEYLGEGRVTPAGRAIADTSRGDTVFVLGDVALEGPMLLHGMAAASTSATLGTPAAMISGQVLLDGDGRLIGPELFLAASDLESGTVERAAAFAHNRLLLLAALVVLVGGVLHATGLIDLAALVGMSR